MLLSNCNFRDNAVRLPKFALAYNLANFLRSLALLDEMAHRPLATMRERFVTIGARIAARPLRGFTVRRGGCTSGTGRRDLSPDRPPENTDIAASGMSKVHKMSLDPARELRPCSQKFSPSQAWMVLAMPRLCLGAPATGFSRIRLSCFQ